MRLFGDTLILQSNPEKKTRWFSYRVKTRHSETDRITLIPGWPTDGSGAMDFLPLARKLGVSFVQAGPTRFNV